MKKNQQLTQFVLISIGLFLILATYILYPKFNEVKFLKKELQKKEVAEIDTTSKNLFENVEYKGFYDLDNQFTVKSEEAYILEEDTNVVYMTNMHVTLHMDDGRIITITSNKGKYNKLTYDCFFNENVKATDGKTIILAENLDLFATEDSASVYNNVSLNNDQGSLRADKVDYNFQTKYYKISMFDEKNVKIKLIEWTVLKNLEL